MTHRNDDFGRAFAGGLRLSSDADQARAKAKEAERAAYRRQYWRDYAKRVRRVFGTLPPAEHEAAKARAAANGRSLWGQIWAESEAYRTQTLVPTNEMAAQQQRLIAELRRIGNNLNQLAKLGHIQAKRGQGSGVIADPRDGIGCETLHQLEALEAAVARFKDLPTHRHDR